jgi:hypothetical protein
MGVNIVLEHAGLNSCRDFDHDGSGTVIVNELVLAVNALLYDCVAE